MATYVLVHGAWHGKWCWEKITPLLAKEHDVLLVDLPGHGEDKTPFHQINLNTYVEAVKSVVFSAGEPVILVGHSMAGMVISQVAEFIPEKIKTLVYLAAFVPANGEFLTQIASRSSYAGIAPLMTIEKDNYRLKLQKGAMLSELMYAKCTQEDATLSITRLTDEPSKPFFDKISLSESKFGQVPKIYIECTEDMTVWINDQRSMQKKIKCSILTLKTDHSPFYSTPIELANLLLSI